MQTPLSIRSTEHTLRAARHCGNNLVMISYHLLQQLSRCTASRACTCAALNQLCTGSASLVRAVVTFCSVLASTARAGIHAKGVLAHYCIVHADLQGHSAPAAHLHTSPQHGVAVPATDIKLEDPRLPLPRFLPQTEKHRPLPSPLPDALHFVKVTVRNRFASWRCRPCSIFHRVAAVMYSACISGHCRAVLSLKSRGNHLDA